MASFSNSRWQYRKEHPNVSTKNRYKANKAKRDVESEGVSLTNCREAELLKNMLFEFSVFYETIKVLYLFIEMGYRCIFYFEKSHYS